MANHTHLDEVWMVVTPHNPHKKKTSLAADQHRLKMVQLATLDNPKVRAKDVEFHLPQPNYTVNTLAHLRQLYPDNTFTLMMGEDNLRTLHKWKNYQDIVRKHSILVYPRALQEGEEATEQSEIDRSNIKMCDAPVMNISSTFLRKCIKDQKDIRYLVADEVINYIANNNLYES